MGETSASGRRDPIGASQRPELRDDDLQLLESAPLEPGLELEDVRIVDTDWTGVQAGSVHVERVSLEDVTLTEARLRGVKLIDVRGTRVNAATCDWGGGDIQRTEFDGSRMTGLSLGEGRLSQVTFVDCKLDYANFRHARLEGVTFESCVLAGADFQAADLHGVRFSDCRLTETDFTKATLDRVDLRGSDLALAGSLLGLRGAIIDTLQLMDLSAAMAAEIGLIVEQA